MFYDLRILKKSAGTVSQLKKNHMLLSEILDCHQAGVFLCCDLLTPPAAPPIASIIIYIVRAVDAFGEYSVTDTGIITDSIAAPGHSLTPSLIVIA